MDLPNTFNVLSIGQRGVGKTVFIAGSYAELHSGSQPDHPQQLWFDCQDSQAQENIEKILNYVAQTGQYLPLTIKITNFNFSLKYHSSWGIQTLCHFRWWDIPGEICDIHNRTFQTMVSNSHGCCVFIDAYALVHKPTYSEVLKRIIIDQVMPIANLVHLNRSKYAFALILTKCDLLQPGLVSHQQLKDGLQPLLSRLDTVRATYKTFYSSIPIVRTEGASTLKAKGVASSLLWLVWELSKVRSSSPTNRLLKLVAPLLPRQLQPQQVIVERALQSQIEPSETLSVKKTLGLNLQPASWKYILLLGLGTISLLGVMSTFLEKDSVVKYVQNSTQRNISLIEQRVQEQPKSLALRLQLAKVYERANQVSKAEAAYDQVLAQQKNNLEALLGKENLRYLQGDSQAAKVLFVQAEKVAPPNLKSHVHTLAQRTLQLSNKPIQISK